MRNFKRVYAAPRFASLPRYAGLGPATPLPALWAHTVDDKNSLVFYQQQSPGLPRNVQHGYRIATIPVAARPQAGLIGNSDVRVGHVLWMEKRLDQSPA